MLITSLVMFVCNTRLYITYNCFVVVVIAYHIICEPENWCDISFIKTHFTSMKCQAEYLGAWWQHACLLLLTFWCNVGVPTLTKVKKECLHLLQNVLHFVIKSQILVDNVIDDDDKCLRKTELPHYATLCIIITSKCFAVTLLNCKYNNIFRTISLLTTMIKYF